MRKLITLCLALLVALPVFAANSGTTGSINVQLTDADIAQALETLSKQANVTILGDSTVKGKVTCNLSGVTVEQALDIFCKMNKLEWRKVYAAADAEGKMSAGSLFKLLDALKELGGSTVIAQDAETRTSTVYVPSAKPDALDASKIATGLKLKEIYLIRAIPEPKSDEQTAKKEQAPQPPAALAPGNPQVAAQQIWNYFSQMPLQESMQIMHELGHMIRNNLTPEQRDAIRQMWGARGDGWRDGRRQ